MIHTHHGLLLGFLATAALASFSAADSPATSPSTTHAWEMLSDGDQSGAEADLLTRIKANHSDVDSIFQLGVLTRSRFDTRGAASCFRVVAKLAPDSDNAAVGNTVMQMDRDRALKNEGAFASLKRLADQHPDRPEYLWMLAVECRTFNRNEEGVAAFERLAKQFRTGPVLLHQTYANMLDELGRHDESLVHRKIAVKLEPEPWSYEGLGNTYTDLKVYKAAAEAYENALKLSPNNEHVLKNLCRSARESGNAAAAQNAALRFFQAFPDSQDALEAASLAGAMKGG